MSSNGSLAPIAPDPSCALRTIRALRDEAFDIVHLHEPCCPGPTLTSMLFTDRPMVGTFHRSGASSAYAVLGGPARRLVNRLRVRFAVSPEARDTAADALGGDYELVFNGIEIEHFAKATPTPTDGPTIFFVGRHEERKGLGVLLDAMALLPPDVRLWVAGEGNQTAALEARTAGDGRIEWLGRLSDADKASRLRGADVFCAPSLHGESFGIVLLEAMAAQTPIVASDLAGYRNVARPDVDAVLVPPGDAVALADALRRVLADPGLATRLVQSGDCRAAELSMDKLAERYVSSYESVLAATP
jgi:phosphatidylinositol alpha-mannosyltransferase